MVAATTTTQTCRLQFTDTYSRRMSPTRGAGDSIDELERPLIVIHPGDHRVKAPVTWQKGLGRRKLAIGCLVAFLLFCAGCALLLLATRRNLRKGWVERQIAEIKLGETSTMSLLYPELVDLVMNDPECVEKIRVVDLKACVVSDKRLARLGELPNLGHIDLEETDGTDIFLRNIRGTESVDSLVLHLTDVSDKGIQYVAEIPGLKALVIVPARSDRYDLNALRNHPTLESIELVYGDSERLPSAHLRVLKSLPSLRCVMLHSRQLSDEEVETLKTMSTLRRLYAPVNSKQRKELREALPHVRIL